MCVLLNLKQPKLGAEVPEQLSTWKELLPYSVDGSLRWQTACHL